jgi:diguanylate cyclase (GGDEF)-like protein
MDASARAALQVWSIAVQAGVAALLAAFFAAMARSVRLAEVRLWATAWSMDASALLAVFWANQPTVSPWQARMLLALYAAAKTAFALFMVAGVRHHVERSYRADLRPAPLVILLLLWSGALALLPPTTALVQLAECVMVAGLFLVGGGWVLRRPQTRRSRWLGYALWLQALLFLHYVPFLLPLVWGGSIVDPGHLAVGSFFDAGAELVVALASLAALENRATLRLRQLNEELLDSRERLRRLVDEDPLTGLFNRRRLRPLLEEVRERGASLVFLDVDDFKKINDYKGHLVGDLCLIRVARTLRDSFRTEDGLFRYGGDEFLVVCPGLPLAQAEARLQKVRERLTSPSEEAPPCSLSVGVAFLPPGGEPERALEEADLKMYASRNRRPQ